MSELEELVILCVGVLNPDAYAYGIKREIKDQTGKSLSLASVHTVLYRLEKSGLLKSELGGQSEKRGGRSKRLFFLTEIASQTVDEIKSVRHNMWARMQML